MPRAEPPLADPHLSVAGNEVTAAELASPVHRSMAYAVAGHYIKFVGLDERSPTAFYSMGVAYAATGDEVLRGIVVDVPIKVIGNDRVRMVLVAGQPLNNSLAPVARMGTGSDLVVQHYSALGDRA